MAVVFAHYHFFIRHIDIVPAQQILRYATNAVDLFFIMSGFFLLYIYRRDFATIRMIRNSLPRFLLYRLGRIYPLHLATLLFFLPLIAIGATDNTGTYLGPSTDNENLTYFTAHIFMYHGWGFFPMSHTAVFNHPSWSLSIEAFIYLIFPILALLAIRISSNFFNLSLTFLIYVYFYSSIFDPLSLLPEHLRSPHQPLDHYPLAIWKDDILRGLLLFISGMCLSNLHHKQFLHRLPWGSITLMLSGILIYYMLNNVLLNYFHWIFPVMIYALANLKGLSERIFSPAPLFYLGTISYSVYLWHIPYALLVNHYYPLNREEFWEWIWIPLIIGLFILSSLSYHTIENPARLWFKRWGSKHLPSESTAS